MSISEEYQSQKWKDYFETHTIELTERGEFSVYTLGLEPDREQSVLLLHHGAGYTGLSFAVFAKTLHQIHNDLAIIAFDVRGHGSTLDVNVKLKLPIVDLVEDVRGLVECLQRQWAAPHNIFLMGHSLGGSVMTRYASNTNEQSILGLVVVDIVEETAIRALSGMPQMLARRPSHFDTLQDAIKWAMDSRLCRNAESAAISIPSQLHTINGRWEWKVDLMGWREDWEGWFTGLSQCFVECQVARLLVLAEVEYLDRTLMVASMQGKFQNAIIRDTGHAIHEDRPSELALLVSTFITRNLLIAKLNEKIPIPPR